MNKKIKHIQLKKLDQHLAEIHICDRPSKGWIYAIRTSLGMSIVQLAKRMGISQQAISQLQVNEVNDSATIKTLRKAAEAMDCQFIYAIVPNRGSLEKILYKQASLKAEELVKSVDYTMQLEAQGVGNLQAKIKEMADDLFKNPNSALWD